MLSFAVGAAFAAAAPQLLANPSGGSVAAGSASFSASGNTFTITNSPGAIINWQQFSIAKDEITRFIQQNAASSVLNRVVSQNPSLLLGTLQSNGRVFLINPSGITFGAGAVIDVAGFAASTLNMSDADFMSGRMRFVGNGSEGGITNAGTIRTAEGGHVYLIAPNVENQASGVITSPKGEVVIAAGNTVELVNAQTPDLRVEYTAPGNQAINAGQVIASSGSVGIYGTLIKNSGLVSASAATIGNGGKIVLKAVKDITLDATSAVQASGATGGSVTVQADTGTLLAQGTIEAKGGEAKGGEIQLLGTQVGLIGTTNVDASGDQGGGTVLVGGNFHGGGPQQNASMVYVGNDVSLKADAVTSGDGGGIAVWSDNGTRFFGTNSARGGLVSGNGGLVEVSGRDYLLYRGRTDTRAHNGLDGLLLLDPDDVTISNSATSADITDATGLFARNDTTNAGANVYWGDIDRDLATTSVQIKTSNGGTLSVSASGNLGTGAYQATTATDNHDLWLNSSGALNIAAGISSAVKTGYEFTGTTINVSGVTIATNGGLVKFDNAMTLTGNAVVNAGTGTISTGAITGGGNDLTLTGVATIGATSGVGALVANQSLTTTST
ncbi:MAG TPA: filamentous hemagglutinin N-terminal domain-containing protein, partial [Burkholderiales bacterium]|nr:filamentous hemagglutinin N-terminal domain-containing protein [Burkholderiales bacterium]